MAKTVELPIDSTTSSQVKAIARCGDIVLVLTDEEGSDTKLLVSTAFLSNASPVFAAMFNGNFSETTRASVADPGEVRLPVDNAACMELLCNLMHLQSRDVPERLELTALADFAKLCDKYDCTEAVRPQARAWVMLLLAETSCQGYATLLTVTYAFDMPDEFRRVSQNRRIS